MALWYAVTRHLAVGFCFHVLCLMAWGTGFGVCRYPSPLGIRYPVFGSMVFLPYPLSLDIRELAHWQGIGLGITEDHGMSG